MADSTIQPQIPDTSLIGSIRDFGSQLYEGAVIGDYSQQAGTVQTIGQIGTGLIPIVGQVADARDTSAALGKVWRGESGGWGGLALALVGWIPGLGDWAKSGGKAIGRSVSVESVEAAARTFSGPQITKSSSLPAGEGFTDKYGNITVSSRGSEIDQRLVLEHELVHSFLSPKMEFLKELRADLRMAGYQKSSFLRYFEEALAETYAQVKVNGLSGIPEGISFPVKNGYVKLSSVISEAALGSVVVGGSAYGVYLVSNNEN